MVPNSRVHLKTEKINIKNKSDDQNDEYAEATGECGIWQMFLFFILAFPIEIVLPGLHFGIIFIAPKTKFRCMERFNAIEGIMNSTCYSDCVKYEYFSDFDDSIITQWDLVCDRAWLANLTQTVCMFGALVGSIIFGFISDRYDRVFWYIVTLKYKLHSLFDLNQSTTKSQNIFTLNAAKSVTLCVKFTLYNVQSSAITKATKFHFSILFQDFSKMPRNYICFRYGRRRTLLLSGLLETCAAFTIPFCSNYWVFITVRFFLGAATAGTMITSFVLLMEIFGPTKRELLGCIFMLPLTAGHFLMAVIAFYFRSWRDITLGAAAPTLIYLTYVMYVPESPKWLISVGRLDEACDVMTKAAKWWVVHWCFNMKECLEIWEENLSEDIYQVLE